MFWSLFQLNQGFFFAFTFSFEHVTREEFRSLIVLFPWRRKSFFLKQKKEQRERETFLSFFWKQTFRRFTIKELLLLMSCVVQFCVVRSMSSERSTRETKNTTRSRVVALWCKTKAALEKNKRTAHKSRASEKGTADEVVVVLLLLSCELFFFALFRAFCWCRCSWRFLQRRSTLRGKGLHFFLAVVREKKKKGYSRLFALF